MNGQRGFTLIELMVSVAVLTVFVSVALRLGVQADREHAMLHGYQRDLSECRRALTKLGDDVRAAGSVEPAPYGVVLRRPAAVVSYEALDGELWRTEADHARCLATCIARLEVREQRGLTRIALVLRGRRRGDVALVSRIARRLDGAKEVR